jgi:aminoglycoside phosphotransferase (APT) family kinase protein
MANYASEALRKMYSLPDLAGLDLLKLAKFLDKMLSKPTSGPLKATLLTGGLSNLTYKVSDGSSDWVVRRPPLGHVLDTAHDMAREYNFIHALENSEVPVPATYLLCEDQSVLGAPFFVMQYVEGACYRRANQLKAVGTERTNAISRSVIDTLSAIHSLDLAEAGLANTGRPEGYLERQIRRWSQQWEQSRTRDLANMDLLATRLSELVPLSPDTALVHGDYRWDNLLVREDDNVGAVVDWEMATVGDPLVDVGLLIVYLRLSRQDILVGNVGTAPGFFDEDTLLQRYFANRSLAPTNVGFYVGLASFKLAAILEGIHRRYQQGNTVGEGFEGVGSVVEPLVASGLEAIDGM